MIRNRLAILWLAALATSAAAAEPLVPGWAWRAPDDRPFPILAWWGPHAHQLTDAIWGDMAAAGFNLCMPPFGDDENNRKALALGRKYGIGIVAIGVEWEKADKPEKAEQFEANLKSKVSQWAHEPAFAAYRLKDEPGAISFPALAKTRDVLKELDPDHWAYNNLFPVYAPCNDEMNFLQSSNYTDYVDKYMEMCRPEVLSYDHYGIRKDNTVTSGYFENLEIIRTAAMKHNVPFWAFVLSTPLRPAFPTPTEGHLRFQLYCNLAYGARCLQYFTYGEAEKTDGLINHQGETQHTYELAKRINREIQHIGPLLLKLQSTAVFHTAPLPDATTEFQGHGGLLKCAGEAVLGFFDGPNGKPYLMVVNRHPGKSADLALTFSDDVAGVGEADRSRPGGTVRPLELTNGELKFTLPDGDAKLLELKRLR
jgi:hypothetical protein